MGLPEHPAQLSLFGVEHLLGDAFAASDPYRLFQQRIYPLLLRARPTLEACYCRDNGRPAREPVLLLGITLLQFMERQPDRQAMATLRYHLGWKLALGQELTLEPLDPSLLVYFRRRLLENQQAKLLFDTILAALIEQGLVPRRGQRRLDSTMVLGLLADLSEAEKLCETMRLAVQYLQKGIGVLPEGFALLVERYVQSRPDWRMDKAQARAYCQKLGEDLLLLRQWLQTQPPELLQEKPLQLLERVYQESFVPDAQGKLEPRKKLLPGSLCNPHEPEAVMGRKGQERWLGYKLQISESVPEANAEPGEPTGGFIVAVHTQVASEGDIRSLEAIRAAEAAAGLETPAQRYVDSAYVSGEQLRSEQEAGGELMGPLGSSKQHPAEAEGFGIAADGQQAICPAGQANEFCRRCEKKERDAEFYRLVWNHCCKECPRRNECLGEKKPERHVEVRVDHGLLQQRRAEQKTEAFQAQMHRRSGIEGTISELVRGHGLRRSRYRGKTKVALGHTLTAAACNAKRWLRRMAYEMTSAANQVVAELAGRCGTAMA